jgi:hypothetical protein
MSSLQMSSASSTEVPSAGIVEMKLEVVVPVSDLDRPRASTTCWGGGRPHHRCGLPGGQFTRPGSECSIIMGTGITLAVPGSVQDLQLTVVDIEAARAALVSAGSTSRRSSTTWAVCPPRRDRGTGNWPRSGACRLRLIRLRSAIPTATAGCSKRSGRRLADGETKQLN